MKQNLKTFQLQCKFIGQKQVGSLNTINFGPSIEAYLYFIIFVFLYYAILHLKFSWQHRQPVC